MKPETITIKATIEKTIEQKITVPLFRKKSYGIPQISDRLFMIHKGINNQFIETSIDLGFDDFSCTKIYSVHVDESSVLNHYNKKGVTEITDTEFFDYYYRVLERLKAFPTLMIQ